LRVGVAGHLELPEKVVITPLLDQILSDLKSALGAANAEYLAAFRDLGAFPASECRLISQLAAGADQFVADRAIRVGYSLQCIFPIDRERYAQDLRRNPGVDTDPAGQLAQLANAASAVLELDGEADPATGDLTKRTYETSALAVLEHSDVLLALVRSDAETRRGGTRWLIDAAEQRGMPIIVVLLDAPGRSHVAHGPSQTRSHKSLDGDWAQRLVRSQLLQRARGYEPSDWFEERFRSHVGTQNAQWALHYRADGQSRHSPVRQWLEDVYRDYFAHWSWAETCANAYRDLYQGAYISISLLGLGAVAGALLGALSPGWSTFGKWLELIALVLLLLLWHRARSRHWREGWLGYRLLEQQLNNAAVLGLIGQALPTVDSPALREFQKQGVWIEGDLRAVIRQASIPAARLDGPNLIEAGRLILSGMIGRQIDYYGAAIEVNRRANERLEIFAIVSLAATLLTAILYLFVHYYAEEHWHWPIVPFRQIAMGAGIFFPALAATLAAIRTQSEFLQLATRYTGMRAHLQSLRERFQSTLDAAERSPSPLLSTQIATYALEAARAMLDEVSQWRSLLFTREIER
jgi:hypothetical protein